MRSKIFVVILSIILVTQLSFGANAITASSTHDVNVSTQLYSSTSCSNLDWIAATYRWIKGRLWSAVEKVEAVYNANYVALGDQTWTVTGD